MIRLVYSTCTASYNKLFQFKCIHYRPFYDQTHQSDIIPKCSSWESYLQHKTPEPAYSSIWYPLMNSNDPATCCFLLGVRDNPIRLVDSNTGEIRASYTAVDHVEQVRAPYSMCFSLDGNRYVLFH